MRRSDLAPALLVLIALAARPWAEGASTDSVKGKGGVVSSHAKKEPGEILSENEMAEMMSGVDFFYSMDFAVSLPVLENYEVVESTGLTATEEGEK